MSDKNESTPEQKLEAYRKNQNGRILFVFLAIVIVVWILIAGGFGSNSDSNTTTATQANPVPAIADTAWIPAGFTQWKADEEIAWRWGTAKETVCTYDRCWSAMVVAKNGCSNGMYAEINLFDKSNIQIGYTNESTSFVAPMQQVRLSFDSFDKEAQSAQISKISCHQ
jgi:hypothetical protein